MPQECPYYNQNKPKDEIEDYLQMMKDCVSAGSFSVSKNREKNWRFIAKYNLRHSKIREILLSITAEEFCHTLNNTKPGYEHEELYVFAPVRKLYDADGSEASVQIYTKFNMVRTGRRTDAVVISLHESEKDIEYAFVGRKE